MAMKPVPQNEEEIRNALSPAEYEVLREKGTERPFTSEFVHEKADGTYGCKVCGNPLFDSSAKFDSKTGWPSFDSAIPNATEVHGDSSHNMERLEISCARCGSHLGHLFGDGPTATGKRYCINGVCLDLEEK